MIRAVSQLTPALVLRENHAGPRLAGELGLS
jgi:hypothetical protein